MIERPVFYRPDGTFVEIVPAIPREEYAAIPAIAIGPCGATPADLAPFDVAWAIDVLR
jgi:hypothetical protein